MADVKVWYGTNGADYFMNSERMNVTLMSSFAGNDTIVNAKSGVRIDAGTDNNLISLSATGGVSVVSGGGKDTVEVAASDNARYYNYINISGGANLINNSNILHSTIVAGSGSDSIITGGYFASIKAGNGNNRISLTTADGNNSIVAGSGKDFVTIFGASGNNYINVGKGNNTVYGGLGNSNTVIASSGNHRVTIGGGLVSLGNGTGSKISLSSYGSASVISGNGNDTLSVAKATNSRYYNVIDMGDGDNYINNSNILHSTIRAGTGNDTIRTGGYYASIFAGDGNNRVSISTSEGNNTITAGDGNNYVSIKGAAGSNVISLGAGDNTVKGGTGNGSTVTAGDGNSRVTIGGGLVSLGNGTGNRVSISSYGGASVISGTGKDTIDVATSDNARYYNFISISGGNNLINNSNILHSTIKAGKGSDTIITGGYFSSISAGNGNNRITVTTADGNNSIVAGSGKDFVTIFGASGNNYINVGKGNNTVYGGLGGSNSVIGGAGNSRVTIGGGLVSLGSGDGNEVSLDGNYGSSSVKSGTGNDTINVSASDNARYYNFISISGGNNLINNSNILHSTIKAGAGNDTIITGGYFASIFAGDGNNRVSLTTADGNNTITTGTGNDYVSITGAAGNNYINVGKGKNTVKGGSGNGSTVLAGDGNNFVTIGGGLVSLGNAVTGSKISLGSYGGASVISGNGNDTLNVAKATNSRYYNVIDMGDGDNYINNSNILHSTISAGAGNDTIITGGYFASIFAGDGDNLISLTTSEGNNTIITGNGNDTILGNASDNLFVYAGGNDFLGENATGSKISLAGESASNLTDISGVAFDSLGTAVLTFNDDTDKTLTLQNAAGLKIVINGTSQILGENAFYSTDQQSVTLTSAYTGEIDASKFTNFNASALDWQTVLLGNVLSNNLRGGKNNDSLWGNAGNDTLKGNAGDDTLTGGSGNDLFIYTAGNDVVTDMENRDTLQIGDGTGFYSTVASDADIVVTAGDGSVILTGAATLDTLNILGTKAVFLNDNGATKITLPAGIAVGDATTRTKAVRFTGNALDNSILGGSGNDTILGKNGNDYISGGAGADKLYGESGNDTLWGGAGNDSLWGGKGDDVFIYRANTGNDTIADYAGGDMLQILKADGASGGTFTASAFSDAKLTLTIDGGGSVVFAGVSESDTFNINDRTYTLTDGTLK